MTPFPTSSTPLNAPSADPDSYSLVVIFPGALLSPVGWESLSAVVVVNNCVAVAPGFLSCPLSLFLPSVSGGRGTIGVHVYVVSCTSDIGNLIQYLPSSP